MAEIIKYQETAVLKHIRHNLRELPAGKKHGNASIDARKKSLNYSLINRGITANEINQYRKELEKEIFRYNRKNLVHAIETVIQMPADCPKEQEEAFFKECYNYVVSKLPMGEKCVLMAEVHKDEHKFVNGTDISKSHIHILYVPAVKDTKHTDFEYKMNADALTRKKILKKFHPELQAFLDKKGITATVFRKRNKSGKTIGLSVKQLKEITDKTGITFNDSLKVDQIVELFAAHPDIQIYDKKLQQKLHSISRSKEPSRSWGDTSTWGTPSKEIDIDIEK